MKTRNTADRSADFLAIFFAIGRRLREEAKECIKTTAEKGSMCTFGDLAVLHYVEDRGVSSMRDIARNLSISPPAVTLLVDGMTKNKLLLRKIDPLDRRTMRIAITPRGSRYLKDGKRRERIVLRNVFSVLDARERSRLMALLKKVATTDLKNKKNNPSTNL
jgi:DNA-binding MarR family transcriptional regulator